MAGTLKFGREFLAQASTPPQVFVFLPAIFLATYWLGGEAPLILLAVLTTLFGTLRSYPSVQNPRRRKLDPVTGLPNRTYLTDMATLTFDTAKSEKLCTAAFQIEIEDFDRVCDRFGHGAASLVMAQLSTRLSSVLRDGDTLARLEGPRFGLVLSPVAQLNLEALLQISARLQSIMAEPFQVDSASAYLTASIGFCQDREVNQPDGTGMLDAAETALIIAKRQRNGAIRAFSPEMDRLVSAQRNLTQEIEKAMEIGQIRPWFQPQISLQDQRVIGFEALARWDHPERGIIPPADFLPLIEDIGMSERLSEVILFSALTSLSSWDKADLNVPSVSVNFSLSELQNPKLLDRIRWNLDRFNLPANRLTVEILETVVSRSDTDIVARNIRLLSELGCRVELDDFGTGQSSIANIQRFSVDRLKIDRSFIANINNDQNQQRMVGAIVTMADQLRIDCLIEGVETAPQQALLTDLGCKYAQGFLFAKPMPPEHVPDWLLRYRDTLDILAPKGPKVKHN